MSNLSLVFKRNIYLIYCANFFISFSYGVFLLLPLYINSIGGNELFSGKLLLLSGVGTILCVVITKSLMHNVKGHILGAVGAIIYGLGACIISFMSQLSDLLIFPVVLIGCGWGICYNCAPFCLSQFVSDAGRAKAFSYLSAFAVLGVGIAPTLIDVLKFHIDFHIIFALAIFSSLISAGLYSLVRQESIVAQDGIKVEHHKISLLALLQSHVKFPLIMVFLGACAFTVMMNFQATYAEEMGLSYAVFYFAYSLSVIVSRLLWSSLVTKYDRFKITILLVTFMLLGLIFFIFIPNHNELYVVAAVLFGIGYGLTYPHIQAIAVNLTDKKFHKDVISYFSLFYFLGIYGFPLFAGKIITSFGYAAIIYTLIIIILIDLLVAMVQFFKIKKI